MQPREGAAAEPVGVAAAAELSVGDGTKPLLALPRGGPGDFRILDAAQFVGADSAFRTPRPRLENRLRTNETAYMFDAERRFDRPASYCGGR